MEEFQGGRESKTPSKSQRTGVLYDGQDLHDSQRSIIWISEVTHSDDERDAEASYDQRPATAAILRGKLTYWPEQIINQCALSVMLRIDLLE